MGSVTAPITAAADGDPKSSQLRGDGRIDDHFAALDDMPAPQTSGLGQARLWTWTEG
jgi:hypothetical protein